MPPDADAALLGYTNAIGLNRKCTRFDPPQRWAIGHTPSNLPCADDPADYWPITPKPGIKFLQSPHPAVTKPLGGKGVKPLV